MIFQLIILVREVGKVKGMMALNFRLLVDTQNGEIARLENILNDTQRDLDQVQSSSCERYDIIQEEAEQKIANLSAIKDEEKDNLRKAYEIQINQIEESFNADQEKIKQQLHDVMMNEINLLNRIKSLEAETSYAQAEMEKLVVKDANKFEYKQELEYKVECLETELSHCKATLSLAESKKIIERSDDDIKQIKEHEETISKLKENVSYLKKELIDSRSRKAAAEDELNTVKGTIETIMNSEKGLSNEIEGLNNQLKLLTRQLNEETERANHLDGLVSAIENQPDMDAKSKIEISDLKSELSISHAEIKVKLEEIHSLKDIVKQEQEVLQQKEIEISRLNGKIQFIEEEIEQLKRQAGDIANLQAETNSLRSNLSMVVDELEVSRGDNIKLSNELQQQQLLYLELKKMRGRGEELDLLQQAQQDLIQVRNVADLYQNKWEECRDELAGWSEEKTRLLRENAKLRSLKITEDPLKQSNEKVATIMEEFEEHSQKNSSLGAGQAVMKNIGSLKLYEILLGVLFITVIFSWKPFIFPM